MSYPRIFKSWIILHLIILISSTLLHSGEFHAPKERTASGTRETLVCSQCHTMHGSQGNSSMVYGGTNALYSKLLRKATPYELCLYCHGELNPGFDFTEFGLTPPQVVFNQQGYLPSAGDFMSQNYINEQNRHSLGLRFDDIELSSSGPPGYTGTWSNVTNKWGDTFMCLYCHDQHGNSNYRNLRYDPGDPSKDNEVNGVAISYRMVGTPTSSCSVAGDIVCDVDNDYETTPLTPSNLTKYQRGNVKFRRSPVDNENPERGIAAFCGRCHTLFHGISGAGNMGGVTSSPAVGVGDNNSNSPWVRHPVRDISIGATNMHTDVTNWGSISSSLRTRFIDPDGTPGNSDDQPFCFSCHYSHGGGNPNNSTNPALDHSNLVMMDSAGVVNLSTAYSATTGRMRNTCLQCHNQ